jgi:hypothetical protein
MPRQSVTFGPSGVVLDEVPAACGLEVYTGCQNFRVEGAGMQLCAGQQVLHPLAGFTPKFGMLAPVDEIAYSLIMGTTGVAVSDGASVVANLVPAGWGDFSAGSMTGAILGGVAAFNQRGKPPWYWDGTLGAGAVKPLPGWITGKNARVLGAFGQHLFAAGMYGAAVEDSLVCWSDAAATGLVPASWVPTVTNQAGSLNLSTGAGPVQALEGLANSLMCWRTSGLFALEYVGRPYIYAARQIALSAGAAALNCVLNVKGTQVALTPGDIVQSDGIQVRSLGEGRLKEWLFAQMSRAGLALAHGYVDNGASEAVFNVALGRDDYCNYSIVWNFERDKWSIRELPLATGAWLGKLAQGVALTWDADSGTWDNDAGFWNEGIPGGYKPKVLAACPSSGVQILDQGYKRWTGENLVGTLERTGLRIGAGDALAKVQRLIPVIEGSAGAVIGIQVGAQLAANGPVSWDAEQPFTLGQSVKHDCNARGRYVAVRFRCAGPSQPTIAGFALDYDEGGRQ